MHENLGPMFYNPNSFSINVEQMLAGAAANSAIGVAAITIFTAHGLKGGDILGNTVDPYIKITQDNRDELARTSIKRDTSTPRWNETKLILVNNLIDVLSFEIFDFNDIRKDRHIGTANFQLSSLADQPEQENLTAQFIHNSKKRGDMNFEIRYFPILEGKTLDDGKKESPPPLNTGIVRFTVHQAKDLDYKRYVGSLNPFVVYYQDGKEVHVTKSLKRISNPVWDDSKELIITNRQRTTLTVVVKDDKGMHGESIVGQYKIKLDDLIDSNEKGVDWFNLKPAGKVRLTSLWKPVALKGVTGSGGYVTPIGVMRLYIKHANGLRNLETVGKVDPYIRVMVNNFHKARTVTYNNTLDPVWNEVVYATIISERESIVLECMDSETNGKDRTLGKITLKAADFVKKNEEGAYVSQVDASDRTTPFVVPGKSPKGTLVFAASFFPTLNIVDPEEEEEEEKEEEKKAAEEAAEVGSCEKISPVEPVTHKKPDQKKAATPVVNGIDKTKNNENDTELTCVAEPQIPPKIKLSPEQLFEYQSGLLVYKVLEGNITKTDTFFQVFFDDMLYPAYTSSRSTSLHPKWQEICDGLVRELEWSRFEIRLTTKERSIRTDNECVIATYTGSTLAILKKAYNHTATISLTGRDGGSNSLKISLKYMPVIMKLEPVEFRNNMGYIRVDALDATDLPAADRSGKSDPYCVFELDGKKVFKTKVIKKTLTPAWNEFFDAVIADRINSSFVVKVYDWDMGPGDDDFLGTAHITISDLTPMEPKVVILRLDGKSGQVRLRLLFKPEYVMRTVHGTPTFSGTFAVPGKVVTSVAGAPIKGVGFAAGGVKKGASIFTRGFKHKHSAASNGDDTSSIASGSHSNKDSK